MKSLITAGALALALGLGIAACGTDLPTEPATTTMSAPQSGQFDRSGPKSRGESLSFDVNGPIMNSAGEVVANLAG
jgi:ABC-type glycerol-3-phosphate transport system substrate-binding protein